MATMEATGTGYVPPYAVVRMDAFGAVQSHPRSPEMGTMKVVDFNSKHLYCWGNPSWPTFSAQVTAADSSPTAGKLELQIWHTDEQAVSKSLLPGKLSSCPAIQNISHGWAFFLGDTVYTRLLENNDS